MHTLVAHMDAASALALAGRGAATLFAVGLSLVLLRRGGEVLAGIVAAIPVTSAPALVWVGVDRGAEFAAAASLSALYATGLAAVYAAVYAAAARRFGRALSLGIAAATTLLVCVATQWMLGDARAVIVFTAACFAASFAAMPPVQAAPARTGARRRDIAFTSIVSGVLTMVVTVIARQTPAQWCGLIAAIPVVGITTIVLVHGRWPLANLRAFLRAYVHGLVAKAFFVGTLAAALVPLGLLPGWIAALLSAALALAMRERIARRLRQFRWAPVRAQNT